MQNLKNRCEEKNDTALKRKIGGGFEWLSTLDAKYHPRCFKLYIKETNQNLFKELHESCFEELIEQIAPRLQSGRAILVDDLLHI